MINLRYHIVSITAVFLALGIGIVLGSSFLDVAVSRRIERNVDTARDDRDKARAERDELQKELDRVNDRDRDLLEKGSETLFADRLTDVPVVILTTGGVDGASLDALRQSLDASRADFEGTITVNEKVTDEDAVDELGEILDVPGGNGPAVHTRLVQSVSDELLDHGVGQGPGAAPPTVMRELLDAGFIDYEAGPGGRPDETMLGSDGYRYVVVTGADADVPGDRFLLPVVQAMTASGPSPVLVASAATGDDPEAREQSRTGALSGFRDDKAVSDNISTVDDLETFEGVAAVILGLDDLGREIYGHYGYGDGADAVLPEP